MTLRSCSKWIVPFDSDIMHYNLVHYGGDVLNDASIKWSDEEETRSGVRDMRANTEIIWNISGWSFYIILSFLIFRIQFCSRYLSFLFLPVSLRCLTHHRLCTGLVYLIVAKALNDQTSKLHRLNDLILSRAFTAREVFAIRTGNLNLGRFPSSLLSLNLFSALALSL